LSTTGKLFEKVILKIVQRHTEETGLLNVIQFGFHACHRPTLQFIRLMDHVILNLNNNMSTAAVFLDIEKAFDTTWHLSLLYKLWELKFAISLIKLISSFLSQRIFRVSVEGETSMPRNIRAGVPKGYGLSPARGTVGVYLSLFADDTRIYTTDHKEGYVLRKLH
jgi:hypothetical protein